MDSITEKSIVIGCNYHLSWQSDSRMRFILKEVKDGKARMATRRTNKNFWCDLKDLIFILSVHNKNKAKEILKQK